MIPSPTTLQMRLTPWPLYRPYIYLDTYFVQNFKFPFNCQISFFLTLTLILEFIYSSDDLLVGRTPVVTIVSLPTLQMIY